jgi:hypothetical protein
MCALLLSTPSQAQGLSNKTMHSLEISTKTTRCYTVCAILITLASWYCHQGHHILPRLLNSEILNTVIFGVLLCNYMQLKLVRTFRKTRSLVAVRIWNLIKTQQSVPPKKRAVFRIFSHLRSCVSSCLFPSDLPTRTSYTPSSPAHIVHPTSPFMA